MSKSTIDVHHRESVSPDEYEYEYEYEYENDDNDEDIYRYQGSHSSVCVEICWKGVCVIHMIEMIIITVFQTLDCQL